VGPDRPSALAAADAAPGLAEARAGLGVRLPPGRDWTVAISPTSWSRDEDMGLLLDALARLELPERAGLLVVATGKGPARAAFEMRAAALARPGLMIATGWLPEAGYRALLAGADLGISLHRSASGLDFPMKIVDMEAAGLPVLALDSGPAFRDRLAGLPDAAVFDDADGLARLLRHRIANGPGTARRGRPAANDRTWETAWQETVLPSLLRALGP
jgi:beta-1,4-mannosyltransferase